MGGRFFLPDIIEAARLRPTGEGYFSEEDQLAIYQPSRRGRRAKVTFGIAERLIQLSAKGQQVSPRYM